MAADLTWLEQADLSRRNTLGLPGKARFLAVVRSEAALREVLSSVPAARLPVTIWGGGSNIVLQGDVDGLVIVMAIAGIRVCGREGDDVLLAAGAGESWHGLTRTTLAMGLSGLENLSLIPGTVGAAPVQNIGAYGVEIKDVLASVRAWDRETRQWVTLSAADCGFAYRDSVFKSVAPGRYIITEVAFRLSASLQPTLRMGYGDIRQWHEQQGIVRPTANTVAQAVIAIRSSKLPDPARIGNAGSFFKNPVIPVAKADQLRQRFPALVGHVQPDGVKVAAGWLIEQAGWKGLRRGAVGVHDRQALVLVHEGGGRGSELLALAADIRASVHEMFGIELEQEPVILGRP